LGELDAQREVVGCACRDVGHDDIAGPETRSESRRSECVVEPEPWRRRGVRVTRLVAMESAVAILIAVEDERLEDPSGRARDGLAARLDAARRFADRIVRS
jgi:hypothetical protein